MKKIVSLVLALVLALSLTACGKTSVTLDKTELTFTAAGETAQLTAEAKKADSIAWTSSDEAVATVDQNGLVTAVAPGTAAITVSAGEEITATCTITCDWTNPVNLLDFVNSVAEKYGEEFAANPAGVMTIPVSADPDMLEMTYPGLSAIETNQMEIYMPSMGAVVCEIAVIEVANASDVEAVKAILQARIDAQIDGGAWYPESIEGWQNNSRIVENGNYVMLIAYSYCDEVVEMFNALF